VFLDQYLLTLSSLWQPYQHITSILLHMAVQYIPTLIYQFTYRFTR